MTRNVLIPNWTGHRIWRVEPDHQTDPEFIRLVCDTLRTVTGEPVHQFVQRSLIIDADIDPTGSELKETGQAHAVSPPALALWKARYKEAVRNLARQRRPFTSEDVIAIVGLPAGDVEMNANNAVGAMMTGLAKAGVICKTGERVQARRPSSHGAELTEWIGTR